MKAKCLRPCEYLTAGGRVCTRNPCPYGRRIEIGQEMAYSKQLYKKNEKLRENKGLSISKFCSLLEIEEEGYEKMKKYAGPMPSPLLEKICNIFKILPDSMNLGADIIFCTGETLKMEVENA